MSFSNHFWQDTDGGSAYKIEHSLRFHSDSTAVDATNPGGENGTYSIWYKRGNLGYNKYIGAGMRWASNDTLNGSTVVFKDYVSWMHVVVHQNGTFVNGIKVSDTPASDTDSVKAGNFGWGCMQTAAKLEFVEGQDLDPTAFGAIGPNGVWVPIKYQGEYGEHGFCLMFDPDADPDIKIALGMDSSGNGNNFTLHSNFITGYGNSQTCTDLDTPTNNCFKPNVWYRSSQSYSWGNCGYFQAVAPSNGSNERLGASFYSALPSSGKWWWQTTVGTAANNGQRNGGFIFTERTIRNFNTAAIHPNIGYFAAFRGGGYRQLIYGLNGSVLGTQDKGSVGDNSQEKGQCVIAWDGDTRKMWFGAVYYNINQGQFTGEIEWLGEYGRNAVPNDPDSNPATGTNPTLDPLPEEYDTVWSYVARKVGDYKNAAGRAIQQTWNYNGLTNVPEGFQYLDASAFDTPAELPDEITGECNNGQVIYTGCLPGRVQYGNTDVTYQNRHAQSDVYFLSYGFWINNSPGYTNFTVTTRHTGGEYIGRKIPHSIALAPSN